MMHLFNFRTIALKFAFPVITYLSKLVIVLGFLTGCAATSYVHKKANDQEYPVASFYNVITRAALLDNTLVLEIERAATPAKYGQPYQQRTKLCFNSQDFNDSVAVYIYSKDSQAHTCPTIPESVFQSLPTLEPFPKQKRGLILPELKAIIYGTGNDTITTRCDCEVLANIGSVPKQVYYFNKYLLYVALENGQWVKLTKGKRALFVTRFQAELVDEMMFKKEKATSTFTAKPALFEILDTQTEQYFFVRLLRSKEYIYSYRLTETKAHPVLSQPITSLFIQNDHVQENVIVEKGNVLFNALYPFSVVFDIITFPLQYGIGIYKLHKATQPQHTRSD